MIHHVQLACPPGSEPALREFYGGVLGLDEIDKPPGLAARGVPAVFRSRPDAGRPAHGPLVHPGPLALGHGAGECGCCRRAAQERG
jgi:catechol 2,3-dioxygenase-like lactoylglutathione lyase family enzyme